MIATLSPTRVVGSWLDLKPQMQMRLHFGMLSGANHNGRHSEMTNRRKLTLALALPAIYLLSLAGAIAHADSDPPAAYAHSHVGAEVCFPARLWSAPSIDGLPCDTINAPEEDGSGRLYLGTLANDLAECTIPNVREERAHFTITCHRVNR